MKAKLIDEKTLVLTAKCKKDKKFLKDAFDDLRLGRKQLVVIGTHLAIELTLEMQENKEMKKDVG
jgi:hypothetical protein